MLKHFHGSILLETLITIVILGLIVTGSFYSYSFVYQRIHFQHQQKIALSVLQGLMEQAMIQGPNAENNLREEFESQRENLFKHGNQTFDSDFGRRGDMTTINLTISLDGFPITLYTEINLN